MKINLGGDRLGSGNKNNLELHNYYRSTHNLSQGFTSPMTVGALYPFLVIPAMPSDKFEIKLDADCLTIPTVGPLFGSFKMQTDVFLCPIRLYQAFLHNNPTALGLKMNQVLLPVYEQNCTIDKDTNTNETGKLNESCLMKYLGVSGIGKGGVEGSDYIAKREFNAVPLLAYYDIFKNYYSNKQEQYAYVIGGEKKLIDELSTDGGGAMDQFSRVIVSILYSKLINNYNGNPYYGLSGLSAGGDDAWKVCYIDILSDTDKAKTNDYQRLNCLVWNDDNEIIFAGTINELNQKSENAFVYWSQTDNEIKVLKARQNDEWKVNGHIVSQFGIQQYTTIEETINIELKPFELKNIDDMRMAILSTHTLGSSFKVHNQNYLPYSINTYENNQFPLNGLVVKTYQSDLFNNWINTDWIDGENGIGEITKLDTSNGLKMDALNLAEKIYNMLNRIAVSGNTYQDWVEVVYSPMNSKHMESPIYCGGMSSEIVFEQIVQTAPADGDPLGTLAGRGRHVKHKGGHIVIKVDEPSFIIGITSITPRVKYSQGNEFYMTELKSVDDMHKPALDGIGFQNLLGERMAWWDTQLNTDGTINSRSVIGKVPAWIEYMTAVDHVYGDFANTDMDENGDPMGKGFMVLNRNYSRDENGEIKDATTYIDPTKYNYAFAYSKLDAQNFWAEIYSHITARRLMSAKQIPNL